MTEQPNEEAAAGSELTTVLGEATAEPAEDYFAKLDRLNREANAIIVDLLLEKGLYSSIDISTEVGDIVAEGLKDATTCTFDTYCIGCKERSTFRIQSTPITRRPPGGKNADRVSPPPLFAVQAVCQRAFHVYTYVFTTRGNTLTKIGQSPSLATLSHGELSGFDKSLDPIDRKELGTALGLSAHGTALGAFVYLRRVFERMVRRAHERQSAAGHPVEGFDTMRMEDRIAALKDELPDKVVRNSAVFSVLSLGLHELTEEQCAKHFPVMKAVLFQMLEQEEHKRKAAITARETDSALQRALSELGGAAA